MPRTGAAPRGRLPPGNPSARGRGGGGRGGQRSSTTGELSTIFDDSDLCGFCSSLVQGEGVACDRCSVWYHTTQQCTGLRPNVLDIINSDGGDGIAFICCNCRFSGANSPNGSSQSISSHDSMVQLYEMVKSLATTVSSITQQVASLASTVQALSTNQINQSSNNIDDNTLFAKFFEFEDRKKRKDCLIVRGVQIQSTDELTDVFQNIAEELINERVTPINLHCINQDKRIYRVTIPDRTKRISILQNAKKLKDSHNYARVYINKDLTFQQRQDFLRRREEAGGRGRTQSGEGPVALTGGNTIPINLQPPAQQTIPAGPTAPATSFRDIIESRVQPPQTRARTSSNPGSFSFRGAALGER